MSSQKLRTGEARLACEKAGGFYVVMGEFGKAADALVKGAQVCESQGSSVATCCRFTHTRASFSRLKKSPSLLSKRFATCRVSS
uniref:Uncharacterized protein n=1 Tax=Peronospora matthiolae TaxID=2874970 RepID=A0AAV1TLT5_9STRA